MILTQKYIFPRLWSEYHTDSEELEELFAKSFYTYSENEEISAEREEKLLEQAEKMGVTLLSITDHDSVDAHLELKNNDYSNIFSGKIIPGCEFSCVFNDIKIELSPDDLLCNSKFSLKDLCEGEYLYQIKAKLLDREESKI